MIEIKSVTRREVRAAARVALASSSAAYRDLPLGNLPTVRVAIARQSPSALERRLLGHARDRMALVCRVDGQVRGVAMWHAAPGRLYCEWLFVAPGWQGRGVGTALLAAMRAAAGRKHRLLELDCLDRNLRALDWYRARGFLALRRERKRWRQATLTAIVLRLTGGS